MIFEALSLFACRTLSEATYSAFPPLSADLLLGLIFFILFWWVFFFP